MPEHQNIEYKSSWHDDYLKWICGFANAQGGRIHIGKDGGGFIVKLFKDRFSKEELQKIGLNDRQIKAVLYVKERGELPMQNIRK
jgi:ATP-dependent DNA helicase RecG